MTGFYIVKTVDVFNYTYMLIIDNLNVGI